MIASHSGESCPRCGGPLSDVWGPANQKTAKWDGTTVVQHNVINTFRCDRCGWNRVEQLTDTDTMLDDLLQSLKS